MKRSLEMPVMENAHGRWTDGWTDRTEFIGLLSALSGIQKRTNHMKLNPVEKNSISDCRPNFLESEDEEVRI